MNTVVAAPAKPHRTEIWGILQDKIKVPHGWPVCLRRQPPRVVFKNNDIYMVNDEEVNSYEELRERYHKVQYKIKKYATIPHLRICPTRKSMMTTTTYFGVLWVWGVCGEVHGTIGVKREGTPIVPYTPCTPLISKTPQTPLHPISVVLSLVSTHIYLCSLTFSLSPDEAASGWR